MTDSLPTNITATLVLQQTGLRGPISTSVLYSGNEPSQAPAHQAMEGLISYLGEYIPLFEHGVDTDTTEYTLTFDLAQETEDGDVYAKLNVEPKITSTNPNEQPLAYQIGCQLMLDWLHAVGTLNENGELQDDESFARVDIEVKPSTRH